MKIKCKCCGRTPEEIMEYCMIAKEEGYETAGEFVVNNEGTYNPDTGLFYCTDCYVKLGTPLGRA